ncbi:M48 family metallopeptidase [Methylobacterium marchantiae]|uniref:M48 family metallopeptidase n=1 Tax=Methylobacterium marchantiae TaxID=600331 RepID=A0ABW3WVY7_9HYPH|nr:Beta-barrel assembly-enhancing protease [Methylobacterium marchantiae]
MASPPIEGTYFDGLSARPHPVILTLEDRLEIAGRDLHLAWTLSDLVAGDTVRPLMRVGPAGSAARVEFTDEGLAAALEARCPDLHRTDPAGSGGRLRLVLWSVAAGISVLLLAIYGVPAIAVRLAPLIPASIESRLGGAVDGQIGRILGDPPACDDAPARAILDRLIDRMTANASLPVDLSIGVRRHAIANALTLPGGRVVVLSDLIEKSATPDEFAGVMAHEFGHVAAHDPMRALLAASGSSFLLSLVLGDLTGSTIIIAVGQAAISAGYSREAENAADSYSVEIMRRSGGDATALATILERIAKDDEHGAFASLLRSHPFTAERANRIRAMAGTDTIGRRILDDADWTTLRGICRNVPGKATKT